jgi:hypothetical protein
MGSDRGLRRKSAAGRLAKAVGNIDRARAALGRARAALAKIAEPTDSRLVSQGDWRKIQTAIKTKAPSLHQRDGVVGTAIGYRRIAGEQSEEPSVIVAVDHKLSARALRLAGRRPLPKSLPLPGGGSVGVDVVSVRGFRRLAFLGSSIGPSDVAEEGTLGAFARGRTNKQAVALTAMHVTGRDDVLPGDLDFVTPSLQDSSLPARLGAFLAGTKQGIDAAAIELDPKVPVESSIPGLGTVASWRPLVYPGDREITVHFYGATSGFQSGTLVEPFVNLPRYGLEEAFLVDIPALPGDSGAGLVDNSRLLLGLLVGELFWEERLLKVFSPMGLVLNRLDCVIP